MDKNIPRRLGKRIAELRRKQGFSSQEAFAAYLNTQRAFIGHLETGRKDFRLSTLIRVAEALDVSLSGLFAGVDGGEAPKDKTNRQGKVDREALLKETAALERSVRHLRALLAGSRAVAPTAAKGAQVLAPPKRRDS